MRSTGERSRRARTGSCGTTLRWIAVSLVRRVLGWRSRVTPQQSPDNVVPIARWEEARARRERAAALLEDLETEQARAPELPYDPDCTGTGEDR